MITRSEPVATRILDCWAAFATAITTDSLDLVGTEDVVSALIDRSLLQGDLDHDGVLEAQDLVRLDCADRAYRDAAPVLLDRTLIALYRDDEPITHWWWHVSS